ncbi:hypothetical protein HPB52_003698 [Rhipicephalus sanguineus]|uniref:RING-type domain-containing protein n=1 Tax=Rhipicephalus sanguineus TaxID=34632 RepID=A0A9D4QBY1_RHISA|nr:hypothetical protein HPB52_003698 [Rhipicephalus sanguineus]
MHLLSDSVSGANWRPTRFEDERLRFTCCVCHVLSDMSVMLRCAHTLCEDCLTGCVVQDGGNVCPLDGKPFCDADCQKIKIYAMAKRYLKAADCIVDVNLWQRVGVSDVCEFLVLRISFVTRQQLKAKKAFDGHNFATSAWVSHSQAVNKPPVEVGFLGNGSLLE